MSSKTEPASQTQKSDNPNGDAYKGMVFLRSLYQMTRTPIGRATTAVTKISFENIKLLSMGNLNPGAQGVIITAVMIRKALHMAGIAEPSQGTACIMATTQLGAGVAIVTAKVGATTTVSLGTLAIPAVFIGAVIVALESYKVGKTCFVRNGNVSHALDLK